jgi:UDP-3-O-[3-hydroxymyristoyl] glucosamine N-acyltransferase
VAGITFTLAELAARLGGHVRGDSSCLIHDVAVIQNARPGTITFLANGRYRKYLATTGASAVILAAEYVQTSPVPALVVDNPYATFARVAALLHPARQDPQGIHETACLAPDCRVHETAWIGPYSVLEAGVEIGPHAYIGAGCYIGEGSAIGEGSRLIAHVTLCQGTRIGKRALIHPGAVIGSDGFGLANEGGAWVKVPQLGGVRIGDDVEIGANTTIDRGTLDDTVLEDGVKLDNQIQLGHNVYIGAHTAIAGCVGIAGSTRLGKRCMIGGGVGIGGHLEIVDDVYITGMSMVTKSIGQPGLYSSGVPLETNRVWRRNMVRLRQLEEFARRLEALEKKLGNER